MKFHKKYDSNEIFTLTARYLWLKLSVTSNGRQLRLLDGISHKNVI